MVLFFKLFVEINKYFCQCDGNLLAETKTETTEEGL